MRAIALLLLPPLAALACVYALAAATGGPTPVRPGANHAFVWKKQVFRSKQQFSVWLERRNVTYADWRARHPGASLPWEDRGHRLEVIALLAAVLAGILAFLIHARRAVGGFVGRILLALLERLRPEEMRGPPVAAGDGFSLREAVAVYGVRSRPQSEQRNGSGRPELVLVDPPPEAPDLAAPEREAVAVAANEAPRRAVETRPRRRRRRAEPRARDVPVEEPVAPAPREEPPVAVEPEPEPAPPGEDAPVAVESEPESAARSEDAPVAVEPEPEPEPEREPEPEPVPEPEPGPEPAVSPPAEVVNDAPTNLEDDTQPDEQATPVAADPESEPPAVAPTDRALTTETPAEQPARPEPESAPAISAAAEPTDPADGRRPDDAERMALAESPPLAPAPPDGDAGISEPIGLNAENGRPVDDLRIHVPEPESPERESPAVSPVPASFGALGSPPPILEVREVFCEIAYWHGFVSGQFYARLWGDTQFSAIATSPKFRSRSETPEQTEECLAALGALTDVLIAEGWTSIGRGRAWYAKRFTNHLAF